MKSRQYAVAVLPLVATVALGCFAEPDVELLGQTEQAAKGGGNGAPSGSHYQLNIIGVPRDKTAAMDANNNGGARIFVRLDGKSKISLAEGDSFDVIDANGTDIDGAKFQLPWGVSGEYEVYARALGTPGGGAIMTTCMDDNDPLTDPICSMSSVELRRSAGKSTFVNVTNELLYLCLDLDTDPSTPCSNVELFSDEMYEYFWEYDNYGLKVAQLRFYEM